MVLEGDASASLFASEKERDVHMFTAVFNKVMRVSAMCITI